MFDFVGFGIFYGGIGLFEFDLFNGFIGVIGLLVEFFIFFFLFNVRNGFIGFFIVLFSVFEILSFLCDRLFCVLLMVLSIVVIFDFLFIGILGFNVGLGVIFGLFFFIGVDIIFFGIIGGLFMVGFCLFVKNVVGMFNLLFFLLVKFVDEDFFVFLRWVVVVIL